jgi:hypothetical protein
MQNITLNHNSKLKTPDMEGDISLTAKRNHGKPQFKGDGPRTCERCGVSIEDRHKNARFCYGCSDRKSKPYVVSVRLDKSTYSKLLKVVENSREKKIQPVLERIVKGALG